MLYHVSIEADDPRHVAEVIAELWNGVATPFPPVAQGSWVAMAGDDRNTMVEVYPRGTALHAGAGDADAYGVQGSARRYGATHIAIGTDLDVAAVFAVARREGWPVKYCKRGGAFGVLELWIEGCQMAEVLTPDMQVEYREMMTVASWRRSLEKAEAPAPA